MSSVTRFIRQIPTGQQYYPQYTLTVTGSELADAAYIFFPDTGNYVGNYPPGYVVAAVDEAGSIYGSLVALQQTVMGGLTQQSIVLRDMGKTIFAPIATDVAGSDVGQNGAGYFRQVQVLIPQPISSTQGFLGGVNGSVFGVYGSSPTYAPYATIYLPTNVAGVFANLNASLLPSPTPQGQM
jgi:hypothetical protein